MNKFKVGDIVIRINDTGVVGFREIVTVVVSEARREPYTTIKRSSGDTYAIGEHNYELVSVYNSPLYRALL